MRQIPFLFAILLLCLTITAQTSQPKTTPSKPPTTAKPPATSGGPVNKEFQAAIEAMQQGRAEEAGKILEKLLKASPENPDYNLAMGTLLTMVGDTQNGLGLIEKATKLKPTSQAYSTLAAAYAEVGRGEEAVAALKKSISLDPTNLAASFNLATIYMQTNQFTEAVPLLDKVVKAKPAEPEPVYMLGLCYSALNKPAESRSLLLKLPVQAREIEQVLLLLASNSLTLNEPQEARKYYERALQLNPVSSPVQANLGSLLLKQGDKERGMELLEKAWKNDRTSYLAGMTLARAYRDAGRPGDARSVLADLLTKGESAEIFVILGQVDDALNNHDRALADYRRAVELEPGEATEFALAYSHIAAGKPDQAEAAFREAMNKLPLSSALRVGLGAAYLAGKKNKEALDTLQPFATKDATTDPRATALYQLASQAAGGSRDEAKIKAAIAELGPR